MLINLHYGYLPVITCYHFSSHFLTILNIPQKIFFDYVLDPYFNDSITHYCSLKNIAFLYSSRYLENFQCFKQYVTFHISKVSVSLYLLKILLLGKSLLPASIENKS